MRALDLTEGEPAYLPSDALSEAQALALVGSKIVDVEFPNPVNGRRFVIRPTSTVGLIPIAGEILVRIRPKVPVSNLFGMLEAVHNLPSFEFYDGIGRVEAIDDIYTRLAVLFARRVAQRVRRGLHAKYVHNEEDTMVVRGRLDVAQSLRIQARGSIAVHCAYEVQTVDIEDNRILLWTLDRIPRLGLPVGEAIREVRATRRALLGTVQLVELTARVCRNRAYNRLNADYALLHALAQFFLERMGPGLAAGDHAFLPFTVDMSMLFQEYVVECLREHAPPGLTITRQYSVEPVGDFRIRFNIDAVIVDKRTGAVLAVIDAKYKRDTKPSTDDAQQVIAYATQTGAQRAFLVYPLALSSEGSIKVGVGRYTDVATVGFTLDGDLDVNAKHFASRIFSRLHA